MDSMLLRMPLRRRLIVWAAAAAGSTVVLALGVDSAWGCSCAARPTSERLRDADAAFVGTVESTRRMPGGSSFEDRLVHTYRVEESYKRNLGERVEIETSTSGGTCGYAAEPGERHGIFLHGAGDNGRYSAGICSLVEPGELRRTAREERVETYRPPDPSPQPPPPVRTERRGALLVAASRHLLLLDREGRTVSTARISFGSVLDVHVCPDSEVVAVLVKARASQQILFYSLHELDLRRARTVDRPTEATPGVRCVRGREQSFRRVRRPAGAGRRTAALGSTRYAVRGRDLLATAGQETRRLRRLRSAPRGLLAIPSLLLPPGVAAAGPGCPARSFPG